MSNDLARALGARVRILRRARGMTGRELAERAEISQPFLSQLESGQSAAALATLYRIANALIVDPADLLPRSPDKGIEVLRAAELFPIPLSEAPNSPIARAVFRRGMRISELRDYLIEPDQHVEEWFASPGEYLVYVIEGSIRSEFDEHPDVVLKAGDAVFCPPLARSRWHLDSKSGARVIVVVVGS